MDPKLYPEPETFDGLQFAKLRQSTDDPATKGKAQFVAVCIHSSVAPPFSFNDLPTVNKRGTVSFNSAPMCRHSWGISIS